MLKDIDLSKVDLQWFAEEGEPPAGDPPKGDGDGDGDKTFPAWMDQLPDDLKKDEGLSQFANIGELAKSRSEVAAERDQLKTDAEGIEKAPEKAEGYELEKPAEMEGVEYKKEFEDLYRDIFHKAGLTQAQAKAVYDGYNEYIIGLAKATNELREKATESQKKAWGADYDKNCELALRFRNAMWPDKDDPFLKMVDETGIGNRADFIEGTYRGGKMIGEDSLGGSSGHHAAPVISEANQKLKERYPNSPELWTENQSEETAHSESSMSLEEAKQRFPNSPDLWPEA